MTDNLVEFVKECPEMPSGRRSLIQVAPRVGEPNSCPHRRGTETRRTILSFAASSKLTYRAFM